MVRVERCNVKQIVLAIALALGVTPAVARFGPTWPAAIGEAPIERAIANVTTDRKLTAAQRERLLGRLHLISYAQGRVRMKHYATGEWALPNETPCTSVCIGVAPRAELPQAVRPVSADALAHLRLARTHYERAVAIDGSVLRARLGLAYALDELNEDDDARVQLREIIVIGLPRLQLPQSNAEDHAILSQAVQHLSDLALSGADRNAIERVRERLGASVPSFPITPIVVPLIDAPFARLIDRASAAAFDFGGIGDKRAQGWLTRDAAWLVWDPNQRGEIRSGFDLIGQRSWGLFWSDGFEALRALDVYSDGELTGS
jgi:hypothetical protein